ncbi:MAG: hypothetical protein KC423_08850 [Anaerolineales bacterium]|nr:hypothetical protein [Anaerolineales bacterium]
MTQFYQQLTTRSHTDDAYWHNMLQLSQMELNNVVLLDNTMSWNDWWLAE